jgi:SAM-dependent methyltransferase
MRNSIIQRHKYYQSVNGYKDPLGQGESLNKWEAMQMPLDLTGKSVLDIGCAEGFFCLKSAERGAQRIVGVDFRWRTLLAAKLIALQNGYDIEYRLGTFTETGFEGKYDYVLCLSVLHHCLSSKNIWKILTDIACEDDRNRLNLYLKCLADQTSPKGHCIVELPYEYDDPSEREKIDFEFINKYFLSAGFKRIANIGTWQHSDRNQMRKDRIIYVADK